MDINASALRTSSSSSVTSIPTSSPASSPSEDAPVWALAPGLHTLKAVAAHDNTAVRYSATSQNWQNCRQVKIQREGMAPHIQPNSSVSTLLVPTLILASTLTQ